MPTIINIENIENELGVKINAELNLNEKGNQFNLSNNYPYQYNLTPTNITIYSIFYKTNKFWLK